MLCFTCLRVYAKIEDSIKMTEEQRKEWISQSSQATKYMSQSNAEQYMIEVRDHMDVLSQHPHLEQYLISSIAHRTALYQSGHAKFPPMLMQRIGETDEEHRDRELEAGGYVKL